MAWHQHSLETVAMVTVPGGDIQYRSYRPHNDEAAARTPLLITHGGPGGSSIGECAGNCLRKANTGT